jgi:flagellar hook-associated protein 2
MATVSSVLTSSQITSLIQAASASFQLPGATLQAQESPINSQISALGKVQSTLSDLQSALSGLSDIDTITQRSVSSSSTAVSASASNAAAVGSYSLTGIHLANAETLASSGSASASASLGAGSLTIKVGSNSAVTVNVASGSSSLSGIAAAIDQADVGVNATVLFDGSTYRLVLTSDTTGTANAFTVTGSGALAGLSYHAGASALSETQAATNAGFSLNGISITSGSNTIGTVIPGLSLTLSASGSATLTVSQNTDELESAAGQVVQAINSTLSVINSESSFSSASGGGPLLGNVQVEELRQSLLNAITDPIGVGTTGTAYFSLASVGVSITSGGAVTFNESAFQTAAQTDYAAVASLLGAVGVASNSNVSVTGVAATPPGTYAVDVTSNSSGTVTGTVNGLSASGTDGVLVVNAPGSLEGLTLQIATGVTGSLGSVTVSQGLFGSLSSVVNAALTSGSGSVTGEINSLDTTIISMNKQIKTLEAEATQETKELTQQYSNAQSTMDQLTTVSSFLSTYFNQTSGAG